MLAVVGDGGFQYAVAELGTAAEHGIDAKLLIVDDGGYGILREYQREAFGETTSVELPGKDLVAVAEATGAGPHGHARRSGRAAGVGVARLRVRPSSYCERGDRRGADAMSAHGRRAAAAPVGDRRRPVCAGRRRPELKARTGRADLIRLNWNENLLGPLDGVLDESRRRCPTPWAYPEEAYEEFRSPSRGWAGADPAQVVPGHGIQALTLSLVAALVDPGDRVVIPRPTYGLYASVCAVAGAEVIRVDTDRRWRST